MTFQESIGTRHTDELILISKSTTEDYQQFAIDLSKQELYSRGFSRDFIDKRYKELTNEIELIQKIEEENMATEDYSVFEKIYIIFLWPEQLLHNWTLKKDGYHLKAKNRIKLIAIGVILYFIAFLIS